MVPDTYLVLTDPDPGGPKTRGSGGSGSETLVPELSKLFQERLTTTAMDPQYLVPVIRVCSQM
jgi:hypothetical protein